MLSYQGTTDLRYHIKPTPRDLIHPTRPRTRPLQQIGKAQAEEPQHASRAVQPRRLEGGRPGRGARRARLAAGPRVDDGGVGRRAGRPGGRRRRRRRVGRLGVLCAAGVVGAAGARARVVRPARRYALAAVLHADKVRERQGVLGDVGLGAVGAEAAVGEGFRIAGVHRRPGLCLVLTDWGAIVDLGGAPALSLRKGDRVGVDVVVCPDCSNESRRGGQQRCPE